MARMDRRDVSPSAAEEKEYETLPSGKADDTAEIPPVQQEIRTSDREELIQCIKRGQRPTWVPKPNLEALCAEANAEGFNVKQAEHKSPQDNPDDMYPAGDLPRLAISPFIPDPIPRPPSALHSGDFHEPPRAATHHSNHVFNPPWIADAPPPKFLRMPSDAALSTQRSRAPSLGSSLSSSFVMRTPTSPLVHATSSLGSDDTDVRASGLQLLEDKARRRRTLPPHAFPSASFSQAEFSTSSPVPALRREAATPCRAHQARRSLTSFTYQPASSAQGIYPNRHRRLSHASETSPRSRTSMVGSFEESILRGRMSTPPSKPLDFVAQIGVLGKADCPAKLKCPAHVSVPFPAVFYSYSSSPGPRTVSDDSPSPYVGTIDLEHHLKPVEEPGRRRKKEESTDPDTVMAELTGPQNTSIGRALARQEARGMTDSTNAPRIILDGAYRVPQQGQLQVIIKNPNKTAVKLFLIPYDLEDMTTGNKTFVRQRSFSSGPIMENVLSDKPIQDPLSNKHVLRYLIHLKFCCPSKGRFYLYDNIRVVFANRVPEGKEKLRNEIQLPEPKYSAFVSDPRSRRQSVTNSPTSSQASMPDQFDMIEGPTQHRFPGAPDVFFSSTSVPFHLGRSLPQAALSEQNATVGGFDHIDVKQDEDVRQDDKPMDALRPQSPEVHGFDRISTSQRGSPVLWNANIDLAGRRSPSPALVTDGLLSRKLRELEKQNSIS
jgi:Domain of unknown function (DUF4210)/Chromosome segregation during meiosis